MALIPRQAERLVDASGFISPSWWKYLNDGSVSAQVNALAAAIGGIISRLSALEATRNLSIIGQMSVVVQGSASNGSIALLLAGDVRNTGNTYYYGTGPTGSKGWSTIASAFTATQPGIELVTSLDGVTDIRPDDDLEALEALATVGLAVRTATDTWVTRSIDQGAGITVTNGDGVAGNPTVAHADTSSVSNLASDNSGGIVLQDIILTFDTFGHVLTATVGTVDLDLRYQPLDGTLSALAANNWAANAIPIGTGADTVSQVSFAASTFPARASTGNLVAKPITDFGLSLMDDADASAARTTLGAEAAITAGTTAQYWRGDKTWRDFATDALAAALTGLSTASNALVTATDTILQAIGKLQAQFQATLAVDGMLLSWNSTTSITISAGRCYTESGLLIALSSPVTLSSLSLSANTWYHLYAAIVSGSPTVVHSTDTPVVYKGSARSRTANTAQRYIGSIRTTTGGAIFNFQHAGGKIFYQEQLDVTPFRVLSNGTATVDTTVACSAIVPISCRSIALRVFNLATSATGLLIHNGLGSNQMYTFNAGNQVFFDFPLNSSQELRYRFSGVPTGGGAYLDVVSYTLER